LSGDDPKHDPKRLHIDTRPTVRLDPADVRPSWPVVVATLEQISDWAALALRLGILALMQECVRALAQPDARAELVVRMRELVEALAHLPFDA